MKIITVLFATLCTAGSIFAQQGSRTGFRSPLGISLNLSGNFGEFRSNHFHTGLDIKTQGKEGLPVYAVTGGCVSRIRVGAYGYGNALYIDHPNGYTSVYAHLQSFNDEIEAYLKKAQYDLESWEVDLYPGDCLLLVDSSAVVAFSGNSGSSGGPHLHFEIRETETEFPVNPLLWDFPVADHRAPLLKGITVEPRDEKASVLGTRNRQLFETTRSTGEVKLYRKAPIEVNGQVGIGVHTIDLLDGNANNCGIHRLVLRLDGDTVFSQSIDRLDFSVNRAMNAHADYQLLKQERKHVHRTFTLPNNRLPIYKNVRNDGSINITDDEIHIASLDVYDIHGNRTSLSFELKRGRAIADEEPEILPSGATRFYFDKVNRITRDSCFLYMKEGSLYDDCWSYIVPASGRWTERSAAEPGQAVKADHFLVGNRYVPVHQEFLLAIQSRDVPSSEAGKLLLAHFDPERERYRAVGGHYHMGWVSTKVKEFGTYTVVLDTVPPTLKLLRFDRSEISFRIADNFSGIDHIEGRVDGQWMRFHYDPKRNRIYYEGKDGILSEGWRKFEIAVSDERGNVQRFTRVNSQ